MMLKDAQRLQCISPATTIFLDIALFVWSEWLHTRDAVVQMGRRQIAVSHVRWPGQVKRSAAQPRSASIVSVAVLTLISSLFQPRF
jgi:hypothetical protein